MVNKMASCSCPTNCLMIWNSHGVIQMIASFFLNIHTGPFRIQGFGIRNFMQLLARLAIFFSCKRDRTCTVIHLVELTCRIWVPLCSPRCSMNGYHSLTFFVGKWSHSFRKCSSRFNSLGAWACLSMEWTSELTQLVLVLVPVSVRFPTKRPKSCKSVPFSVEMGAGGAFTFSETCKHINKRMSAIVNRRQHISVIVQSTVWCVVANANPSE